MSPKSATTTTFQSDLDLISSLHREPYFLPRSERFYLIQLILIVMFTVTFIYEFLFRCLSNRQNYKDTSSQSVITPSQKIILQKTTQQVINLLVNLFLGIYGIYVWTTCVPHPPSSVPIDQKVTGFQEYLPFASLQIGYNLWALPMGLFVTHEPRAMVLHHTAVLIVAGVCGFTTCGFRYYAPFFLGVVEISSVPLAIMNLLRERTEKWVSSVYPWVRGTFGVAFLVTRVVGWTLETWDVLKNVLLFCYTCESRVCYLSLGCFLISGLSLTALQYYWGWKVCKGLWVLAVGCPRKSD